MRITVVVAGAVACVAEAIQADTGNEGVLELVPEAIRSNPVIFPDESSLERLVFTVDLGEEGRRPLRGRRGRCSKLDARDWLAVGPDVVGDMVA
jgi:hypothetical protein